MFAVVLLSAFLALHRCVQQAVAFLESTPLSDGSGFTLLTHRFIRTGFSRGRQDMEGACGS